MKGWRAIEMRSIDSASVAVVFLCSCLGLTLLLAASSARAQVVAWPSRALFTNAAPNATNIINFENHSGTEGFLPDFTELGFVTFHTNANCNQEVIDGFNIGAPGNKVYITVAADLGKTIADITFGRGVLAVGFDLKNTG